MNLIKRLLLPILASALLAACSSTPNAPQGADLHEAARINTELGVDYMRRGDVSTALIKLRRAIDENPDYAPAHSAIAYLYAQRGDAGAAEKEYRKALSLAPDDPSVQNNFGVFLCAHGKPDEAQRYFAEAAADRNYATPAAAWSNAGSCAMNQKQPDRAEDYFRTALKIDPQFSEALAQMAGLAYQHKDYLRARAFIQRYEAVGKPTPKTLWLAAMTEQALGNTAGAHDYANRLKLNFPESDEAANINLQ
ncbi:MAG: type IV pilus biogenesis/stability protein PilW [Stenotrophobium sp.]